MSNSAIKKIKIKANKLPNDFNIKLIKGNKKYIRYITDFINNGKNIKIKLIDLRIKNKYMVYCGELPFDILSYSSYIALGKMKMVFSIVENNEYKLLKTKSKKIINALGLLKVLLFMDIL